MSSIFLTNIQMNNLSYFHYFRAKYYFLINCHKIIKRT